MPQLSQRTLVPDVVYGPPQLLARFPLFGGWKTQWYHGYNIPLEDAVSIDGTGGYSLALPFGASLQNAAVDQLRVKVVLPEGAHDITVESPHARVESSESRRYGYVWRRCATNMSTHRTLYPEACAGSWTRRWVGDQWWCCKCGTSWTRCKACCVCSIACRHCTCCASRCCWWLRLQCPGLAAACTGEHVCDEQLTVEVTKQGMLALAPNAQSLRKTPALPANDAQGTARAL